MSISLTTICKCKATKKDGKPCLFRAKDNGYCGRHGNSQAIRPDNTKQRIALTYTYGMIENGVGMEQIGKLENRGYTLENLCEINNNFQRMGASTELVRLDPIILPEGKVFYPKQPAAVLIIRNGVDILLSDELTEKESIQSESNISHKMADALLQEQIILEWDKKKLSRGRVVNAIARYNLCYADVAQDPCYEKGKGTIITFNQIPLTSMLRQKLGNILPSNILFENVSDQDRLLNCEGNFYYNSTCGIGFHGDAERKTVICVSLGSSTVLDYRWYQNKKPVGNTIRFELNHGDIYIMSEKATGNDWRKYKDDLCTLRHAAGSAKYRDSK